MSASAHTSGRRETRSRRSLGVLNQSRPPPSTLADAASSGNDGIPSRVTRRGRAYRTMTPARSHRGRISSGGAWVTGERGREQRSWLCRAPHGATLRSMVPGGAGAEDPAARGGGPDRWAAIAPFGRRRLAIGLAVSAALAFAAFALLGQAADYGHVWAALRRAD